RGPGCRAESGWAAQARDGSLCARTHSAHVRARAHFPNSGTTGPITLVENVAMRELTCALLLASAAFAMIGCSDEPKPAKAETPATSVALLTADTTTID